MPSIDYTLTSNKGLTELEITALNITRLLVNQKAAVIDAFEPSLTTNIQAPTPNEALSICFNLLSWIDNSLNIGNTLTNFVIYTAKNHKTSQQNIDMEKLFESEFHHLRALATLFLRRVIKPFSIDTIVGGEKQTLQFNVNDPILITNAVKGHALGYAPRKCPFSTHIIPSFLSYFFQRYQAEIHGPIQLPADSASWFWNKLDSQHLVIKPRNKSTYTDHP